MANFKVTEKQLKFYFFPKYLNIFPKTIYIKVYKSFSKNNNYDFL